MRDKMWLSVQIDPSNVKCQKKLTPPAISIVAEYDKRRAIRLLSDGARYGTKSSSVAEL